MSDARVANFEKATGWLEAVLGQRDDRLALMAADWLDEHKFTRDTRGAFVEALWFAGGAPTEDAASMDEWTRMWEAAGFYSNARWRRPQGPLLVYRGALSARGPMGLSWTTNLGLARAYARSRGDRRTGAVYAAEVKPAAVLAILDMAHVPESIQDQDSGTMAIASEHIDEVHAGGPLVEVIVHPDATTDATKIILSPPERSSPLLPSTLR